MPSIKRGHISYNNTMKNIKTNYLKYLIIILTSYFFITCHFNNKAEIISNTSTNKELIEINIDNQDYENTVSYSDLFNSVKFVPLETNRNCLIGQIDEIELYNDTIFILDKSIGKAIYMFDKNGSFIKKIGQLGKGPGEYFSPKSFTIDNYTKQIKILDEGKLLIFSIYGEFQKEILLSHYDSPRYLKSINGITYFDYPMFQGRIASYLLSAIDSTGLILKRWLPYKEYNKGLILSFGTSNHLVNTSYDIKFMQPFFDTIFSICCNDIKPFISISTKNNITTDEINEFNGLTDVREISDFYWKSKKFLGVKSYIENDNLIIFDFQTEGTTHTAFYNPLNKSFIFSRYEFQNNLIPIEGYFPFYTAYNNYFISVIDNSNNNFVRLMENINNGSIILSENQILVLKKLTPESNPVVVFYECKKNPVFTKAK